MPQGSWAFENPKKSFGSSGRKLPFVNTIGENQTPSPPHLHGPIGIVDVDITAYRTIHHLEQRRCYCLVMTYLIFDFRLKVGDNVKVMRWYFVHRKMKKLLGQALAQSGKKTKTTW